MNKFLVPSVAGAVSLLFVFLSVERPRPVPDPALADSLKSPAATPAQKPSLDPPQQKRRHSYPKLEARNIFSADGRYGMAAEQKSLEGPSFTLLGVIGGKTKTAIFRESGGAIVAVKQGESLANGATVTHIDRLSATAERGAEKREFVIFDVNGRPPPGGPR